MTCPECAAPIAERFCGRCGEARPDAAEPTLRHFATELAEHLAQLDFRLVRTLLLLVRRPGQLTLDFVQGRRARYTRPLALYLFVSGAFFAIAPHLRGGMKNPAAEYIGAPSASAYASVFDPIARRDGVTREVLAARVSTSSLSTSRAASTLLVPAMAIVLGVLLAFRRRFAVEHVLLAIHLQAFLLIVVAAVMGGAYPLGWAAGRAARAIGLPRAPGGILLNVLAGAVAAAVVCGVLHHLYAALRRAYSLERWGAAWRTAAILVAVPFALEFGRFGLVYIAARFQVP